ncbi:hypothetical protein [Streptomyces spinosirectus]
MPYDPERIQEHMALGVERPFSLPTTPEEAMSHMDRLLRSRKRRPGRQ